MGKIAVLGASGPTGIHLAAILRAQGEDVRAVSRSAKRLADALPDPAVEKLAADVGDAGETLRAVKGCALVYDCIGLAGDQMHMHGVTARNIARALAETKARCVQVSSYWAYYPQARAVMDETHPRSGGSPWMRHRREAEDILLQAGAAVLHLPDFYGPQAHVSTLQNALREATQGKTVNWLGRPDIAREYIYVPDAMRIAAAIGRRDEAFGQHWCLAGSGPLSGRQVVEIAARHLARPMKLRAAGLIMLRLVSLFNSELRGFMQIAPEYMKAVRYDARRLESLLGAPAMTPYERGIAQTLDWLTAGGPP
jgi:nucleoside-diphosphate-sugar epimerase